MPNKMLHLVPMHGKVLPRHIVPIEKGAALPVGHVSHRKDGDYRKVSKNNWVRIRKPSEQEPQDEATVKENAFISIKNGVDGKPTNLTNLPDWAVGGVYNFGGHTFAAIRPFRSLTENGEVVLGSRWSFVETTTGLSGATADTPEDAKKEFEHSVQNMADMGGSTVQEKLDQVIEKARDKASQKDFVEFNGPYIKGMGDQDWMQFSTEVAKAYGDEEQPNWVDVENAVRSFYKDEIAAGSTYLSGPKSEVWFVKNRDNLPTELYDYVRLYTGVRTLAENIWTQAELQPNWTQQVFADYDTSKTEVIDAVAIYLNDRMHTKKWGTGGWRELAEDINLHEMKPYGGLELSNILEDLNEVFEAELQPYEEEYSEPDYDDPYDALPDSIHFEVEEWSKDELYDLGAWVQGTVSPVRESVKEYDNERRKSVSGDLEHPIATTLMRKSTRYPEIKQLYRGTGNKAWGEAKPGDVLDVGMASFTHNQRVAERDFAGNSTASVLVIDREDYDGGGFLGVDIADMLDEMAEVGAEADNRLIESAGVNAHEREKEFVLRAPRLEVKSVEESQGQGRPSYVHVRLVDGHMLEKSVWNTYYEDKDYDRIAMMERTFDYHLADEPEEWE